MTFVSKAFAADNSLVTLSVANIYPGTRLYWHRQHTRYEVGELIENNKNISLVFTHEPFKTLINFNAHNNKSSLDGATFKNQSSEQEFEYLMGTLTLSGQQKGANEPLFFNRDKFSSLSFNNLRLDDSPSWTRQADNNSKRASHSESDHDSSSSKSHSFNSSSRMSLGCSEPIGVSPASQRSMHGSSSRSEECDSFSMKKNILPEEDLPVDSAMTRPPARSRAKNRI